MMRARASLALALALGFVASAEARPAAPTDWERAARAGTYTVPLHCSLSDVHVYTVRGTALRQRRSPGGFRWVRGRDSVTVATYNVAARRFTVRRGKLHLAAWCG